MPWAQSAIPVLTRSLRDQDFYVRERAAYALGKMSPDAKTAIPSLIDLLHNENPSVDLAHDKYSPRAAAAWALGAMGADAKAAIPLLREAAEHDRQPYVRDTAAKALQKIEKE